MHINARFGGIVHLDKLVIFGTGDVARVVFDCIKNDKDSLMEVECFCVDREYYKEDTLFGIPVIPFDNIEERYPPEKYKMFIAMGFSNMNRDRMRKCVEAREKGYKLASYVHPCADVASSAKIGENCLVLNNVSVESFSEVGNNTFVFCGSIISHHSKVDENCWIASGSVIGGKSIVGKDCFLGITSIVGHSTIIGNHCFIGAGAKVTRNADDDSVYVIQDTPKYRLNTDTFMRFTNFS